MKTHFLLFTWENNMPLMFGFGNGLKSENLCKCESELVINEPAYQKIVKKTIHKEKNIELIVHVFSDADTYSISNSKIIVDKKEYDIIDYVSYQSLQIENFCCDNIGVCKLTHDIFS